MTAELLLHYQRCKRRAFLDAYGNLRVRDSPSDLLLKLQQDKQTHQQRVLQEQTYEQPQYPKRDWEAGAKATLELMQQGVDRIRQGVLMTSTDEGVTLVSRPDLLVKHSGQSSLGDWMYVPSQIELGKRPKQEYQVVAAYNAYLVAAMQGVYPETAWLLLRRTGAYAVNLLIWLPRMQAVLEECIQALGATLPPDVFISRQRCSLCRWFNHCYAIAKSEQHLSLLPGVTPSRYSQLQVLNLTSIESLAYASTTKLETVFGNAMAQQLVLQAQSVIHNRPLLLPVSTGDFGHQPIAPVELYFDIEAQPEVELDYLLGVLVVDRQANTEIFHALLAERPEGEALVWQQFLDLVGQYPSAPIFHFCAYEVDTVKRLAKLYHTPREQVRTILNRFVDVYEQVINTVALPVESYALKSIARWLGFEWRDSQASGSQCIYWYDQWLGTGDRQFLDTIQRYNEDDCRATRQVKDWLVNFMQEVRGQQSLGISTYPHELVTND